MAQDDDLVDQDTVPRYKITCVKMPHITRVVKIKPDEINCALCESKIDPRKSCMTVKELIWQNALIKANSAVMERRYSVLPSHTATINKAHSETRSHRIGLRVVIEH